MAWADFFREDFNGAAGTPASGWVPTTDLPGKKWFLYSAPYGTTNDAAQAALDGSGAVNLPGPAPSNIVGWDAAALAPDITASITGSSGAASWVWYPYATAPKKIAVEIQLVVPQLTGADVAAGMTLDGGAALSVSLADPSNGTDYNGTLNDYSGVTATFQLYRRPTGENEISVTLDAYDVDNSLSGGAWSGTYPPGVATGNIVTVFRLEIDPATKVCTALVDGVVVRSMTVGAPISWPASYRPYATPISVGAFLTDYNTQTAQDTLKANYVLIQGDSVEVAAFVPPGGGGTSVTSSGAALTATASISGGSVVAGSNATAAGAALTATASILGGDVSFPGTVNQAGAALTATATISGGTATGLQYTPDGTLLIYDDFVGTLDSTPMSVVDGMAWGAKGTMEPASVDTTFFDNGATALKKALFFAGRKVFDFEYDYNTDIAGISQVLPSASRSTPGFAMTMSVVPAKAYKVRADMQERCVAQMFFAVETTEGLEMMRCAVSGFGPFALDNSPGQYCEIVLAKTGSNFEMYPPQRNAPATITGLSNTVFKVRVEGQTVSAYLNGVLITGVRLPAPVVALHSFAFDVTSYNRVNYALVEAATLRPRVWAQTRGVYECA